MSDTDTDTAILQAAARLREESNATRQVVRDIEERMKGVNRECEDARTALLALADPSVLAPPSGS